MKRILIILLSLLLVVGLMGCSSNEGNQEGDPEIDINPVEEENEETSEPESVVTLYFGNEEGYLRKEIRTISGEPTAERGNILVEELIKGTQSPEDTLNVLPEGTQVLDYQYDENGLV